MSTETENTPAAQETPQEQPQVAMYQQLNRPASAEDEPEIPFLNNPPKSFWD